MNEITIGEEVKAELTSQNLNMLTLAHGLMIKTETDNTQALNLLTGLKQARKKVEDVFSPVVKAQKAAYDEAKKLRDTFLAPLENAEEEIRGKIGVFVKTENARREELQKKEDKKFEKAVAKADKTGMPITVAPVVIPTVSSTQNASYRTNWRAEVFDIKALVMAISSGIVPIEAVTPNGPFLNALARTSKDKLNIPGVKAVSEVNTAIK